MIPRSPILRTLRRSTHTTKHILKPSTIHPPITKIQSQLIRHASHAPLPHRTIRPLTVSSKSPADTKIEEITELYATAQDEFEIALEETEKATVYAEEDRKAAREELTKVQKAYRDVIEGEDAALAEEVKRRIGQRIRELERAVEAMEEMAMNQD